MSSADSLFSANNSTGVDVVFQAHIINATILAPADSNVVHYTVQVPGTPIFRGDSVTFETSVLAANCLLLIGLCSVKRRAVEVILFISS